MVTFLLHLAFTNIVAGDSFKFSFNSKICIFVLNKKKDFLIYELKITKYFDYFQKTYA